VKFLDIDELSEERFLREEVHRFVKEVVRPVSLELDRMPAEDRIKSDSPYFKVIKLMKKLGYHKIHLPADLGGSELTPLQRNIIMEELGWGSLGLATAIGVDQIPFVNVALIGDEKQFEDIVRPWIEDTKCRYHGCWGVTEPEHGSDYLMFVREEEPGKYGKGNVRAVKEDGEWVINGQKSAWVSSAPVATHCGLHVQVGDSIADGIFCVVPLDLPGIKRGKPVEMLGMRDGPQGEIFFNNLRIPEEYVIVAPTPFYKIFCDQLLCLTSVGFASFLTGLARATFEEALEYSQNRIQGGKPICQHQEIKIKLYRMFEKVETSRYYTRKAMEHVHHRILEERTFNASPRHSRAAQIYAKKVAFEVANDALQIFGAYGLSKDLIIEKLFRDARAGLIEDGTVEVLSLESADDIIENYWSD
jgi:alkylation response protein AidB-like acyl-CoA dehydrogenase